MPMTQATLAALLAASLLFAGGCGGLRAARARRAEAQTAARLPPAPPPTAPAGAGSETADAASPVPSPAPTIRTDPAAAAEARKNAARLYAAGDLEGALAEADRAVRLDPSSPAGFANRGVLRSAARRHDDAVADLDRAVAMGPARAEYRRKRGLVRQARADDESGPMLSAQDRRAVLEAALADLEAAVRLDPDLPMVYAQRGAVLFELGELDAAAADLKTALERAPDEASREAVRKLAAAVDAQRAR